MFDDPSSPVAISRKSPVGLWVFLSSLMLLLVFCGATLWLAGAQKGDADPDETRRGELRARTLAGLRTENAQRLESYAWIDRAKGTVQIPITEAMKLVLMEINKTKPRAAYPVATPQAPAAAESEGP
jgi:hypothetical protein